MYPLISLSELYQLKNKKDKIKTNTYNVILEKCHSKIKRIAEHGGMNIFFQVPFVMIGYPLYDINDCIDYIVKALRKNGLLVQIMSKPNNNTIYISWKPTDVNTKKQLQTSRPF